MFKTLLHTNFQNICLYLLVIFITYSRADSSQVGTKGVLIGRDEYTSDDSGPLSPSTDHWLANLENRRIIHVLSKRTEATNTPGMWFGPRLGKRISQTPTTKFTPWTFVILKSDNSPPNYHSAADDADERAFEERFQYNNNQ